MDGSRKHTLESDNLENQIQNLIKEDENNEDEEISDAFTCCVCLDLLYKPIVLTCGHVSCFWCVHYSMNGVRESHCPICRQPYYHFPTVCQLFYFLILKIYPNAYKRREAQISEQERRRKVSSPQIVACNHPLQFNKDVNHFGNFNNSNLEQAEPAEQGQSSSVSRTKPAASSEPIATAVEVFDPSDKLDGICKKASISDVLCSGCNQMLFRPVVLNCGHVYCETCINKPANEVLRCNTCQWAHPNGLPKVCLVLDQYLEEQFPEDYKHRKEAFKLDQANICNETPSACSSSVKASEEGSSWWNDPHSRIHYAVGCDFCGMYPIVGDRYKCKDCTEQIGFDLCADCYNTHSKLPGRFNQQHKPEHKFELIRPNYMHHNFMLRLVTEQVDVNNTWFDNGPVNFIVSDDVTDNLEFEPSGSTSSEDSDNSEDETAISDPLENQPNEQSE